MAQVPVKRRYRTAARECSRRPLLVSPLRDMTMTLRAGDWVEVRSKEEIFATLDENGRLEDLPFMLQMLEYCGQRFQVFKRAGKTCSEVRGPTGVVVYVSRRLRDTVHLEHRCDGRAYGGCQAGCLIFWKEAWLKHVDATNSRGHQTRELLLDRASTLNSSREDQILRQPRIGGRITMSGIRAKPPS